MPKNHKKLIAKRPRTKAQDADVLRVSVFNLTSEMEEPLREAVQLVRVLSLVHTAESEDMESISFVATKANIMLRKLNKSVRGLFDACQ